MTHAPDCPAGLAYLPGQHAYVCTCVAPRPITREELESSEHMAPAGEDLMLAYHALEHLCASYRELVRRALEHLCASYRELVRRADATVKAMNIDELRKALSLLEDWIAPAMEAHNGH